ncbi:hypothetical protein [Cryobacterium soli]|uniref:hypothetical protein n=1 Tax=Cryobacterium soli TaxID=2220095 RepID=UPI0013C49A5B
MEEQFYLVWPLVLMVAMRWKRTRTVFVVAGSSILVVLTSTLVLASPNFDRIYSLPSSWALAMLIGAAAYFGQEHISRRLPTSRTASRVTVAASLAVLAGISLGPDLKAYAVTYVVIGPVIALATVVLINFVRHWNSADTLAASASVPWHDLLRALSLELCHRRMAE